MRVNIIWVFLVFFSLPVSAHSIFMDCKQEGADVSCIASFSDGSSAENIAYEVLSYEDEVLLQGMTDRSSGFKFPVPVNDYYVLLDAGPGHVVDVDMTDIHTP